MWIDRRCQLRLVVHVLEIVGGLLVETMGTTPDSLLVLTAFPQNIVIVVDHGLRIVQIALNRLQGALRSVCA